MAVVLAASGVAQGGIPADGGTITGCVGRTGSLRVIDAEAGESCRDRETEITWNQEGAEGPEGPEGPQGPGGFSADCNEGLAPDDEMVRVGSVCIDVYEASIWDAPEGGNQIIGTAPSDYCNPNGQDCADIYARSVPGVEPAANITWFQAQQALANSGKRLPTSAEWQMAVAGTPDDTGEGTTSCNTRSGSVADSGATEGSQEECKSNHGTFDQVGNLWEWVADWVPRSTVCGEWSFSGDDQQCLAGAATGGEPGALIRGGNFFFGTDAGPFAVSGDFQPSPSDLSVGFRGAR